RAPRGHGRSALAAAEEPSGGQLLARGQDGARPVRRGEAAAEAARRARAAEEVAGRASEPEAGGGTEARTRGLRRALVELINGVERRPVLPTRWGCSCPPSTEIPNTGRCGP